MIGLLCKAHFLLSQGQGACETHALFSRSYDPLEVCSEARRGITEVSAVSAALSSLLAYRERMDAGRAATGPSRGWVRHRGRGLTAAPVVPASPSSVHHSPAAPLRPPQTGLTTAGTAPLLLWPLRPPPGVGLGEVGPCRTQREALSRPPGIQRCCETRFRFRHEIKT